MDEGEHMKLVLHGLSSLMKDDNGAPEHLNLNKGVSSYVIPHFAHALFRDYLFNSSRSGPFHVDPQECKKPGYCTELRTHYAIDSVLEVSNSYDIPSQPIVYSQS